MTETVPLAWRELLIEVMFEAERRGLGTVGVQFTAAAGRGNEAANFIDARSEHLAAIRFGED